MLSWVRDLSVWIRMHGSHLREFTEVVTSHLWLDLDGGERLSVLNDSQHLVRPKLCCLTHVDTDDGTDHLWDDDHVSQVSLNHSGLLVGGSLLLGVSELLDETHGLSL